MYFFVLNISLFYRDLRYHKIQQLRLTNTKQNYITFFSNLISGTNEIFNKDSPKQINSIIYVVTRKLGNIPVSIIEE